MITDPLAIAALIAGITALAFWLDHRFELLSKIGASLMVIILGAVLSNAGIVPQDSPVYRGIEGPVTSLAIVYLLLGVRLADLREAGPAMLGLFILASIGTALGSLAGAALFFDSLGSDTWKLAGAFTGTYTGGSLNFAAIGRGLDLPASTFAAASAADAVTTALWMGFILMSPIVLGRWLGSPAQTVQAGPGAAVAGRPPGSAEPRPEPQRARDESEHHPYWSPVPIALFDLVLLAAIGMAVLIAAGALARWVGLFPEILWLTTIALALGHWPAVRRVRGSSQIGNLGLHLFFAVIGIRSLLAAMVEIGPEVFFYTLVAVAIHGIFLFSLGRILKASVPMLAVVSQAAIGGPSTAMAVAVSRGWASLMLPGVAVGLLGYALGNYAGFGVAYLVRAILGG